MWAAALGVRLARIPIPSRRLRERLYRTIYGNKYAALNEDELDRPLAEFRSLNELFTRGVRPEFRPISDGESMFVCPCDGTVQDIGHVRRDTVLSIKGIEYSLESLVPVVDTRPYRGGAFAVLFLSPANCHRVFAPASGTLREIVHVPGRRLLVHPPYQRREFPVFTLNQRVVLRLQTRLGECLVVMVAGWGVGNITYPFQTELRLSRRRVTRQQFGTPRPVERGEWFATFELGSTVILVTEENAGIRPEITPDAEVAYGQPAFSFPMKRD